MKASINFTPHKLAKMPDTIAIEIKPKPCNKSNSAGEKEYTKSITAELNKMPYIKNDRLDVEDNFIAI